jgi:hypothetical protein
MATTTPNFGWPVPTSTDLVKDGATAIEALGDGIDTSLIDLKGGTTGQVLSKTTNTDMDFTWVTTDDANAIQNSIVDAKGDIVAASANDTPARLAVGANGETLVADSSTSTGLRYQGNYAAGKNKIINGAFDNWQRGTSFSFVSSGGYTADRFLADSGGSGTVAVTRQTFTPGQTDVPNAVYFYQAAYSVSGTTPAIISTRLEDVNTFAGQTATFSFYAKINTGTQTITPRYVQDFGSGGSTTVVTNMTAQTLTTSWQRFTITSTIPSVSGKTIGTSSYLRLDLLAATSGTLTYQIANLQLEAGSVATAFQTATGTIQGELAACQRYYVRIGDTTTNATLSIGTSNSAGTVSIQSISLPVAMRVPPATLDYANIRLSDGSTGYTITSATLINGTTLRGNISCATSGMTAFRLTMLDGSATGNYVGFSAEL